MLCSPDPELVSELYPKNPWWGGAGAKGPGPKSQHFKSLPNLQPHPSPTLCVPCSCGQVQSPESPLPEEEEEQKGARDPNHRDVRKIPLAGVGGLRVRPWTPGATLTPQQQVALQESIWGPPG